MSSRRKVAVWLGWRNDIVEAAVIARATGLASYSGDSETANRYIDKIFDIIELLEKNPQMGHASAKAPGFRSFVIGSPAAGSPDSLVYYYDEGRNEIIGEGVFTTLPAKYR